MSMIQLIKDVIKLFYAKKEEKVIVEIPISEELKELIKRNFNVKYDGYKIFRFNYFLENIYCFLLKNKENDFLALRICKNYVDSISTINVCISNTMEFGNTYFKTKDIHFIIKDTIFVNKQNKIIDKKINGVISKEYFKNISFLNVDEFEVFLKICDLDQLEEEINCQIDDTILKQIRKKYNK